MPEQEKRETAREPKKENALLGFFALGAAGKRLPRKEREKKARLLSLCVAAIIFAVLSVAQLAAGAVNSTEEEIPPQARNAASAEPPRAEQAPAVQPEAAPEPIPEAEPTPASVLAPEPAPAPEPVPAAPNLLDSMSGDERREINIFLSNFSEQGFGDYDASSGDAQRIDFAFRNNKLNGSSVKTQGNVESMQADKLHEIAQRFFGRSVTHQSTALLTHADGRYTRPAAEKEAANFVTVTDTLTQNENGSLTARFTVYEIDTAQLTGKFSALYRCTPAQIAGEPAARTYAAGEAEVFPQTYYGEATYYLEAYRVSAT